MIDRATYDRAETLAEIAPSDTVTAPLLAGAEGRFATPPLHEPPVSYLEPAESPAYVLSNGKRGIGLGSKRNTVSPSRDHESVAEASYKTGFRANRLTLKTPQNIYHCWVTRKTDEDLLTAVTAFIEDRQQAEPEEMDSDENASRVLYRGRPVQQNTEADEPTTSGEEQTVMYRGLPVDDSD